MDKISVWDKARIQTLLATNDKAVLRATALIYNNQTEAEKRDHVSIQDNGIGFSRIDAAFMAESAELIKRGANMPVARFSITRNKVKKYWRQILKDMEERGYAVKYK